MIPISLIITFLIVYIAIRDTLVTFVPSIAVELLWLLELSLLKLLHLDQLVAENSRQVRLSASRVTIGFNIFVPRRASTSD